MAGIARFFLFFPIVLFFLPWSCSPSGRGTEAGREGVGEVGRGGDSGGELLFDGGEQSDGAAAIERYGVSEGREDFPFEGEVGAVEGSSSGEGEEVKPDGGSLLPTVRLELRERLCVASKMPVGPKSERSFRRKFFVQKLREAGVRWIRHEFLWIAVEPRRGKFNFSRYRGEVELARRAGLKYVGVLAYGNPWASSKTERDHRYPPDNFGDFVNYALKVAGEFRGKIDRWEVWNEPNGGYRFWKTAPKGDPAGYGKLLAMTAKALKSAYPEVKVAFGGTFFHSQVITGAIPFIRKVFALYPQLAGLLDRLAIHPYPLYPPRAEPESSEKGELPIWEMLRQTAQFLPRRPLWITEVGWPTYGRVDPRRQALYLARAFLLSFAHGSELTCWYTFADGPDHGTFPPEDDFGLFEYSDSWSKNPPRPKPAYLALRTLGTLLGDLELVEVASRRFGLKSGEFALQLSGNGRSVLALWRREKAPARTVKLQIPPNRPRFRAYSVYGRELKLQTKGNTIFLQLSDEPVYIEFRR